MKNIKFLIVLLIVISGFTSTSEVKAQSFSISFSTFQRDLSPYGRWYNHPRYGQVWSYNQADFRPYYSDGHWEYTDYGWEWVSDYDWGWAPFHYGRWEYEPFYGWIWIPGYEWAPAWVSWSSYDGYYGWAPMGYGHSINMSFNSIPYERWTFVPRQHICDNNMSSYYISPHRHRNFRNATIINNVYNGSGREGRYYSGPDRNEVQRYTRTSIQERRVDTREKYGLFKPRGKFNNDNNDRGANNNNVRWNNGNRDVNNNNPNWNNGNRGNRGNGQDNNVQQDQRPKWQERQQQDQQGPIQKMNQQRQEQQQREQQMEQQRQQQMEQQRRQQQIDQQQKQQQMEQQRQQQLEQQRRQQQDQQRPTWQQQRQEQPRQQPVFQGPPQREERKQETRQESNGNGNG